MKVAALLALLLAMPASGATYYVSNAGVDGNAGTSPATAWQTVGRVNTFIALTGGSGPQPGDQILFQRGGAWQDDYIKCLNVVNAVAGWTTITNPPTCSGSSSAQLVFGAYGTGANPIIDAADTLSLTWTLVTGTTYSATVAGAMPAKLYVDGATADTPQLLPVPNATGAYSGATTYNPYDMVTNTDTFIRGPVAASSGVNTNVVNVWLDMKNPNVGNTSQTFSPTNTGLQNVEAIPGSWYGTGTTIYVSLADGSNPTGHVIEGTRRPYGILLEGVNYVTVQNFTVAHTQQSGIASICYPQDAGTYFVGEFNRIINNNVWNYNNIVLDNLALQVHNNNLNGGILYRTHGQYDPHLVRGALVKGNHVGTMDQYFAILDGSVVNNQSGIYMAGVDSDKVESNYVSTFNLSGIHHDTNNIFVSTGKLLNTGGQVVGNYLTNNQGNIYFSATAGGLDAFNVIINTYGEGVQSGGNSTSTIPQPQIHAFNLVAHVGKGASGAIFNGFDCNTQGGSAVGLYFINNTVYDANSAATTFEGSGSSGCTNNHVHNNIYDQNALRFPTFDIINPSLLMFFVNGLGNLNPDFTNNLWLVGNNANPWHSTATQYSTCSLYFAGWPETSSICGSDPLFVSPGSNNWTLQSGSPARGAGVAGVDMGAYSYHAVPPPRN